MNRRRLLRCMRQGQVRNVRYADFIHLIEGFGFRYDRTRGRHEMYLHPAVPRPLPLQPERGQAKAFEIRQWLDLVEEYNLELEED